MAQIADLAFRITKDTMCLLAIHWLSQVAVVLQDRQYQTTHLHSRPCAFDVCVLWRTKARQPLQATLECFQLSMGFRATPTRTQTTAVAKRSTHALQRAAKSRQLGTVALTEQAICRPAPCQTAGTSLLWQAVALRADPAPSLRGDQNSKLDADAKSGELIAN